jgi:hypothetical protein
VWARPGDEARGGRGEEQLRRERGGQHPAPLGGEEPVEAAEDEGAEAEGEQRDA